MDSKTFIKTLNEHNHGVNQQKVESQQLRIRVRKQKVESRQLRIRVRKQKVESQQLRIRVRKQKVESQQLRIRVRKQKVESQHLRIRVRKASGDITERPSKIIRTELQANLECLSNNVQDAFVDGTFKCCPRYFFQMYTLHGCKNGNYVPLVYALLPGKSEECYTNMWNFILQLCEQRNLVLKPQAIHVDFEQAMHNMILRMLPGSKLDCCRFHLGQNWWRKIQDLGLSTEYREKTGDIGKWSSSFLWVTISTAGSD
ncbi:unnamed protein product [Mytilus coruscus]|uniref:MULE transposase domain-containing protein n=1 Tax=Mytilus coruscus TaxID=42192 RepID=A0A6J8CCL1_MYTCO|nr:unnamed protein product [Mytilus coruscus]